MDDSMVLVGVIGKAHGIRGLVHVRAFTEDHETLGRYCPLLDKHGRKFLVEWMSGQIAQLGEITPAGRRIITDRNEIEKLVNTELFVPRSALPEPEDDEFYIFDLVGLKAVSLNGALLGTITEVHDYGAGTSLEISPGPLLVPFTREAVPVVDLTAGHVIINPPSETAAAL